MLVKCAKCGNVRKIPDKCAATLKCTKCDHFEVIFDQNVKLTCTFCHKVVEYKANSIVNITNKTCRDIKVLGGRYVWKVLVNKDNKRGNSKVKR